MSKLVENCFIFSQMSPVIILINGLINELPVIKGAALERRFPAAEELTLFDADDVEGPLDVALLQTTSAEHFGVTHCNRKPNSI